MMFRGDQVKLPHETTGPRVGLVIECDTNGRVLVYTGRDSRQEPRLEEFVECELMLTGKHFSQPARDVQREAQRLTAGAR